MGFTPQVSWGAKFQWPDQIKISREIHLSAALAPNTQQENSNYENTYPSYRNRCHAWLELVRLGARRDHDHHDSRDYHGSAAGGDAADNDYSDLRLLVASYVHGSARRMVARSFLSLPESRFRLSLLLPPG
jgi:hypothetical protein